MPNRTQRPALNPKQTPIVHGHIELKEDER
ncbi:uncharacterized protein G2W53_021126 [Senna tora]|uniref:Uncharacterized protein n=1 Tax=Senna tora TaxID=362788 RepID=A0A834WHJ3_9FABA|nr:uncharacterized protein G2W53_021126 [Senna tora]